MPEKYPIDQKFFDENLSRTFFYSKNECFSAVKKALGYQGFEIEYEKLDDGKIVSNRKPFEVNASSHRTVASRGTSSTGESVTTYHNQTSNYVAKESHQFYLNVIGDTAKCEVNAFRWRAWNGAAEMKELQAPGIEWAKSNLFEPFYAEVERFLENRPY